MPQNITKIKAITDLVFKIARGCSAHINPKIIGIMLQYGSISQNDFWNKPTIQKPISMFTKNIKFIRIKGFQYINWDKDKLAFLSVIYS